MGLTAAGPQSPPEVVVWHDLECGSYRADLPLWRELAETCCAAGEPLLDVGAGTGRVTLDLARRGQPVDALDRDRDLLGALAQRAQGLPVTTFEADARSFVLEQTGYPLVIVPMQTIQLLDGPQQRLDFLRCARSHMRAGGLLAIAIVTEVDPFDCTAGDRGPLPERTRIGERSYASRPVRVTERGSEFVIERTRTIRPGAGAQSNVVRLARLDEQALWLESRAAGFSARASLQVSETADHSGSEVVLLDAA